MGRFVKGSVVVVPFPFSDLSQTKNRPALVVQSLQGSDIILCAITSQAGTNADAIGLAQTDFQQGGLNRPSNIRPDKIFTCSDTIVRYQTGLITITKMAEVIQGITTILNR